jgi:hypothetical protein
MELTPFLFGVYKLVKYALYPLNWVLLVMMLTTLLLWLPFSPQRLRWARIGAVAGLGLLIAISNPLVARTLLGSLEAWHGPPTLLQDDRYDAIVVLGGGVLQPGTLRPTADLSSYSKNRTTCGVDLYQQGYAPKLVFSGGNGYACRDALRRQSSLKTNRGRPTKMRPKPSVSSAQGQFCWSRRPSICRGRRRCLRSKAFGSCQCRAIF